MDDEDMAKYPGLTQRKGVWQVRKLVPADLKHIFKKPVRESLKTRDRREAVRAYHLKIAEAELAFERAREELRARPIVEEALACGSIENLGRPALEGLVLQWWQRRKEIREPVTSGTQDVKVALATLAAEINDRNRAEEQGHDHVGDAVDRMLVEFGSAAREHHVGKIRTRVQYPSVNKEALAYHQLRILVSQALGFEQMLAHDNVTGDRTTPRHPLFNPAGSSDPAMVRTVADLISAFSEDRKSLNRAPTSGKKYVILIRAIQETWTPNLPLVEITRARCVELVNFIESLPSNGVKKFPKLTLAHMAEVAGRDGHKLLSEGSVKSYVQGLCAMLRWGRRQGLPINVDTEGLAPSGLPETERRALSPNELLILFRKLAEIRPDEAHKFWVPAIAAYTGARAGEICQLRTEDVINVAGISCLNLTRFDPAGRAVRGKRFKNRNSERIVPVHDELLSAGFQKFIEACDPNGRLFPAIVPSGNGSYSHNFSKWFGRFMTRIGLPDPSLVFHSFRHGFRDACRDADIPGETADALGGWASINQGQKYGNRGKVPNLHRALKKIGYEEFRLTEVVCAAEIVPANAE